MAEYDAIEYWMGELANRSQGTRKLYLGRLNGFVEWAQIPPNELIDMKKVTLKSSNDRRDGRVLETKVKAYLHHLEQRGLAPATRRLAYASINSFFASNRYPLDFTPLDRPSGDSEGSRIPEKSEVKMMLNAAKGRRVRALILFLKDSGLRVSDVVRLRWDQAVDYGGGFWGWRIVTKKRSVKATPFVGPETVEALNQLPRKGERIFPMTAKTASNALYDIIKDAGLKGVSGHGLRKFFNVEMEGARVQEEYRLRMMGKRTGPYDENRMRIIFEAYKGGYDHLRVFAMDTAAFEAVKKSLKELQEENRRLHEKTMEIEGLKRQMTDQQQTIKNMEKALSDIHRMFQSSISKKS